MQKEGLPFVLEAAYQALQKSAGRRISIFVHPQAVFH
jgi:hypothetical protein